MSSSVLVIDDSLTVRMDLKSAFEGGGYDCTLAATLAAGRAALEKNLFDLIVLDVQLPDGDGVGFLSELKATVETRPIPVILLSLEADVRARVRGLSTGADEYVGKPIRAKSFVSGSSSWLSLTGITWSKARAAPRDCA